MFGFPSTTHKYFNKNFLKTVIFQISFDENIKCIENKDEIISLFSSNFPRVNQNVTKGFQISFKQKEQTPILQSLNEDQGIEMKSDDGQKIIFINKTSFSVTVSGRAYKNFNKLTEEVEKINEFFTICGITTVKKIAIRKMNIVEFKISDNPSSTLEYIISPDLLSNLSYFPKSELIKQNIQTVNYINDECRLNLKYGLNVPPPPNTELGQIIIDIDLINLANNEISKVFDAANLMNQEIFNVFSWSINDNTLTLLNE